MYTYKYVCIHTADDLLSLFSMFQTFLYNQTGRVPFNSFGTENNWKPVINSLRHLSSKHCTFHSAEMFITDWRYVTLSVNKCKKYLCAKRKGRILARLYTRACDNGFGSILPRAHYEFGVKKAGHVRVRWHCAYVGTDLGGNFQWWFRSVEAFDSGYH